MAYSLAQRRQFSYGLPPLPSFAQPRPSGVPLPASLQLPELTPAETGESADAPLFPRLAARFPRAAQAARRAGDAVGNFGERFPRAAGVIDKNRDTMMNVGLALLLSRSGNTMGQDALSALSYGRASDQDRADRERADRERAEAEEAQRRSAELFRTMLHGGGTGAAAGLPALPADGAATIDAERRDGTWMVAGATPDQVTLARRNAIAGIESGGEEDPYRAIGPVADDEGHRAYGRYQVMDYNIGPWTQQVLGRAMTPQEFLADDAAQDRVFDTVFSEYAQQYGEEGAARAWFGGPGRATSGGSASDVNGMTVDRYGQRAAAAMGGAPAPAAAPAAQPAGLSALGFTDQQLGLLDMMLGDPQMAQFAQSMILERAFAAPEATTEPPEHEVFLGPDGKPHRYGWNPQSGQFDIDLGIAASTGAGVEVNIPGQPTIGAIPQGYQAIQDPTTGAWRYERIPGGPQDEAATVARGEEINTAGVVVEDINRALDMAGTWTTGFIGNLAQQIPGTPAYDLARLLDTIAANVGFAELQQMRAASPTGGALGQVTVRELELLQATMGNLVQSQSQSQFRENLERLRSSYLDTIHGPGNWTIDAQGAITVTPTGAQPAAAAPPVITPSAASPTTWRTATNPQTGERVRLNPATNQWEPF